VEILQDDGLRQQYDARLLQELQQLRTQNEQEMQSLRDEIASQYEKKVKRSLVFSKSNEKILIGRSKIYKIQIVVISNKYIIIVMILSHIVNVLKKQQKLEIYATKKCYN
jgi:hypothetical protein